MFVGGFFNQDSHDQVYLFKFSSKYVCFQYFLKMSYQTAPHSISMKSWMVMSLNGETSKFHNWSLLLRVVSAVI